MKDLIKLANLPISDEQAKSLESAFSETLEVFKNLTDLDISQTEPTNQVTGQENVLREDKIDEDRMLTQSQALQSAKHTHEGFFVVPRLIDEK
ncbi:MAG: Asp-tRNA(Asn)/Glu-tRNA(Gln) amidotransferase subunit GatC [Candidatus Pacebacteria bacterium]|nr:Asp-tRNA(Asn)/Glu-tRNA(Gln) amidotransferase subunit GatC [Candidatus Paceibacterota bacterium]